MCVLGIEEEITEGGRWKGNILFSVEEDYIYKVGYRFYNW